MTFSYRSIIYLDHSPPTPLVSLSRLTLTFISCVTASKSLTSLSINFSSIKQWVVGGEET